MTAGLQAQRRETYRSRESAGSGDPRRAAIEDLTGPPAREPYTHDPHRVFHVAHVARRIVQFRAPLESVERGYNRVDLRLATGGSQKVIWLEMVLGP